MLPTVSPLRRAARARPQGAPGGPRSATATAGPRGGTRATVPTHMFLGPGQAAAPPRRRPVPARPKDIVEHRLTVLAQRVDGVLEARKLRLGVGQEALVGPSRRRLRPRPPVPAEPPPHGKGGPAMESVPDLEHQTVSPHVIGAASVRVAPRRSPISAWGPAGGVARRRRVHSSGEGSGPPLGGMRRATGARSNAFRGRTPCGVLLTTSAHSGRWRYTA